MAVHALRDPLTPAHPADPNYWFPICEECDVDATHLAPPAQTPWWRFSCPRHANASQVTIQRVRDGHRPGTQDPAWRAAWAAICGTRKPDATEGFPERVASQHSTGPTGTNTRSTPDATAGARHLSLVPETAGPKWTPHDAMPTEFVPGHWADGTPMPEYVPEEDL